MKHIKFLFFALAMVAALALLTPVHAAASTSLVVGNCAGDSDLRTKLTQLQNGTGGTLTFNCSTATITLTSLLPHIVKNTVIDGGGKITLSGNDATTLFVVNESGTLKLKNIILERGYAQSDHGGAVLNLGHLIVENSTIRQSITQALFNGGAIATYGPLDITNSTLSNNIAGNGGAIFASDPGQTFIVNISDSKFLNNTAAGNKAGGAISALAPLDIRHSLFAGNKAGSGGAIYEQSLTRFSLMFYNNFHDNETTGTAPYGNGGALVVDGSSMNIGTNTFKKNSALKGGAIYVAPNRNLTLDDSTVSENVANDGGGIASSGNSDLTRITLFGNKAIVGGGIKLDNGTNKLTNVTLSGNSAVNFGGGLYTGNGAATLTNVTVVGNSAMLGGGIDQVSGTMTLSNTIIAKGLSGENCYGFTGGDTSLSDDNTCHFGLSGRDGIDLKLGGLANNGGSTLTHLPQVGSPAIDTGTNSVCPEKDQRGISRPQAGWCDAGAVEVVGTTPCNQKPPAPLLSKPTNNATVSTAQVSLDWNDVPCTPIYKVVVKQDSKQGLRVFRKKISVSTAKTTPLASGHSYYWRVRACNLFGCKPSVWFKFIRP